MKKKTVIQLISFCLIPHLINLLIIPLQIGSSGLDFLISILFYLANFLPVLLGVFPMESFPNFMNEYEFAGGLDYPIVIFLNTIGWVILGFSIKFLCKKFSFSSSD